jgi:hypothetical protein
MGTNYYYVNEYQKIRTHIGKSSGGWCFSLHVEEDGNIPENLDEWMELFQICDPDGSYVYIEDEYGSIVHPVTMIRIITCREWKGRDYPDDNTLRLNSAVKGPCGLLRAKIDGQHCIGHGTGTWDHIVGEFS